MVGAVVTLCHECKEDDRNKTWKHLGSQWQLSLGSNPETSLTFLTSYGWDNFISKFAFYVYLSSFPVLPHDESITLPGLHPTDGSSWQIILCSEETSQDKLRLSAEQPLPRPWGQDPVERELPRRLATLPARVHSIVCTLSLLGWILTEVLALAAVSLSIWWWFQRVRSQNVTTGFQNHKLWEDLRSTCTHSFKRSRLSSQLRVCRRWLWGQ